LERRLVEEKANIQRQTKASLEKQKLLQTRLQNGNEKTWSLLNALLEKVKSHIQHNQLNGFF